MPRMFNPGIIPSTMSATQTTTQATARKIDCQLWKRTFGLWL